MNRRHFLSATALAAALAAAPLMRRAHAAPGADRYVRYRGQTVAMSIPEHPHYDAMLRVLAAFTRHTGIHVEVDRRPIPAMKRLQGQALSAAQGDYDLVSYFAKWRDPYVRARLIRDLTPYLRDPALADPAYDLADIVPAYLENIGLAGGPRGDPAGPGVGLFGLPYGAETSILAYRQDLFAGLGLQAPRNYAQLRHLLPLLRERTGLGALASRARAGHHCVHAWLLHLAPLGGRVFDAGWRPRLNDAAGCEALELLKRIVDTGPPGAPGFDQHDMLQAFLQGEAAMYLDSTLVFGAVRDPARSRVAGKVAYALHPRGVRAASQTGGLGLAIPTNARHPQAAFLLLQWLTAKRQDRWVTLAGGVPARMSTMRDARVLERFPEYRIMRQQLCFADPDWRPLVAAWDGLDVGCMGSAIADALNGRKTVREALDGAAAEVAAVMQRAGYYGA